MLWQLRVPSLLRVGAWLTGTLPFVLVVVKSSHNAEAYFFLLLPSMIEDAVICEAACCGLHEHHWAAAGVQHWAITPLCEVHGVLAKVANDVAALRQRQRNWLKVNE